MYFLFLKYINPTSYLFLKKFEDQSNLDINTIKNYENSLRIPFDYKSILSEEVDIEYQLLSKGFNDKIKYYPTNVIINVGDNYIFIRKYFNSFWSFWILCIRVIEFNNPIVEVISYLKSLKFKRQYLFNDVFENKIINRFHSKLIASNPMISVIIPTLNRYEFLINALRDLEKQTYKNFEVIVVDQSSNFNKEFFNQFELKLKVIFQEERALWLARNTAIKISYGSYIAMYEDDVRVQDDWLENHLKCIDYFNCDISAGVFFPQNSIIPKEKSFFKVADQFATGNTLLKKEVFYKIGLFDRSFEGQRMGDAEFGFRSYINGFKSISNPLAFCIDIKAPIGGLRERGGSWDSFRPKSLLDPRPVPSVLFVIRKYFGNQAAIYTLLNSIPLSLLPYKYKRKIFLFPFYLFIYLPFYPILLFQILRSWHISNKMLINNNKIKFL